MITTIRNSLVRSLAASLFFVAASAHAVTYDLTADLLANPSANANGVWSYGWSPVNSTGTYTFQAFDVSAVNSNTIGWSASQLNELGTPAFWYNGTGQTMHGVADGQVSLHPGPDGADGFAFDNAAIVRFTAPVTGSYNPHISFWDGDIGMTEVWVVRNGDFNLGLLAHPPVLESMMGPAASANMVGLLLNKGDTVDLVVGNYTDNFGADNTPISFSMTTTVAAVPEPEQWALVLAGLGVVGALRRRRWALAAAAGLALAINQPAQAAYFEAYTAVDGGGAHGAPDQQVFNTTGAPLVSATGGALATSTLLNLHVSASDTTHWILGPFAAAHGDLRFSVAGAGEPATVSFTFVVMGGIDLSLTSNHNVGANYNLELSGMGVDGASAGLNDVNCLGCGGHLEYSYEQSQGVTTSPWDWSSINEVYTLSTTVETGRQDAGLIRVGTSLGVNGTHGSIDIRMTSLLLNGQAATLVDSGAAGWSVAAVPEPASYGLAMAGLFVVGLSRRRRT